MTTHATASPTGGSGASWHRLRSTAVHAGARTIAVTENSEESSSINFRRSVKYGLGVLATSLQVWAARVGIARARFLNPDGRRLEVDVSPTDAE